MRREPTPRVFLDANVLVDAQLRDLFCGFAEASLLQVRWSDEVLAETRAALVDKRGFDRDKVDRMIGDLRRSIPGAMVSGFERHAYELPDPDDRHVLAAAAHGRCDWLVTLNLRDFPSRTVADAGCAVVHHDGAIAEVAVAHPKRVGHVVDAVRGRLRNPPVSREAYLSRLEQRAPTGAKALRTALEASPRSVAAAARSSPRTPAGVARSSLATGLVR